MTNHMDEMKKLVGEIGKIHRQMFEVGKREYRDQVNRGPDPNLEMMAGWLQKTTQLKEFYNLDQTQKYQHPLGCDSEGVAVAARSEGKAQASQILDVLKDTGCAVRDLGYGGKYQVGWWEKSPTLLPSKFMIDFVESTYNILQQVNARLAALENYNKELERKLGEKMEEISRKSARE